MTKKFTIKSLFLVLTFLVALFVFVGCKTEKDPTLSFDKTSYEVEVGETVKLNPAIANLANGVVEYKLDKEGIVAAKEGNEFEAVAAGEVKITASLKGYDAITVEITIVVKEKAAVEYTVKFAETGETLKVKEGEKVAKPADPEKEGYEFKGWFTDEALTVAYDFEVAVVADLTLYAKWEEVKVEVEYTVTFAETGETVKVKEGEKVAKPADPEKEGYEFKGWFTDEALTVAYDFDQAVVADLTLYAKWEEVKVEATKGTIAEIVAAEVGLYEATALVVGVNAQSFLIKDETGAMLVYLGKNYAQDLKVGDKVKVTGTTSVYGKAKQFGQDAVYEKLAEETVNHGEAKELTAADCDAYAALETITPEYVKVVGTLAVSGNYFNLTIEGATIIGSLTYPANADELKAFDGKAIEVTGYVTGTASKDKYLNFMVTEVKEVKEEVVYDYSKLLVAQNLEGTEVEVNGVKYYVGETAFTSVNEALAKALDGAEIYILAGTYEITELINVDKAITFVGPNADKKVNDERVEEAIFTSDNYNTGSFVPAAANITFNGLGFKGIGNSGYPIQAGEVLENFTIKSCYFENVNTVLCSFASTQFKGTLTITDTLNNNSLQFLAWIDGASELVKFEYTNNKVYGEVAEHFAGKGMISFRATDSSAEILIENNEFDFANYTLASNPFYALSGSIIVKNNKFTGLTEDKLFHEGTVEARTVEGNEFPVVEYTVTFAETGETVKVKEGEKVAKPADPTKDGYEFKGWFSDEALTVVYDFDAAVEADLTLYAKWEEVIIEGSDIVVGDTYKTLEDALAAAKDGDTIILPAGEYAKEITINVSNITIIGPNAGINGAKVARQAEAVFTAKVTIGANVTGVTIDGCEFNGAGAVGLEAGVSDIAVQYCIFTNTTQDGVVRGPAEGEVSNIKMNYNYSEALKSNRFGHFAATINGLEMVGNVLEGASSFDFLNVGGILKGEVLIAENKYGPSQQSFLYIKAVGAMNCTIAGNYIESTANTIIDMRDMKEDGAVNIDIYCNEFKDAGAGWMPIRIRTAGYDANDSIAVNVYDNKFIDSNCLADDGTAEFMNNPSFDAQVDPFKVIYTVGKNYYEVEGKALTEVTNANFRGSALTVGGVYGSANEVPGYINGPEVLVPTIIVDPNNPDAYKTLKEALGKAQEGDVISLAAGTYDESVTINTPYITIVGPNEVLGEERNPEAILTGTITVDAAATNLLLKGLAFTGAANIKGTQVINFTFENNNVYDTNNAAADWKEASGYNYGFIYFKAATGSESKNIMIKNNVFDNVSDANVNISYVENVSFDGNVFNNFDRDAIRFDTGGFNFGILAFTNNKFTQDELGGYNGIYFRIYGGNSTNDTTIIIEGNEFKNIGNASAGLYSGAISARNYQEKGADIRIENNLFEKCYNYIRIRNNGTAANHASSTWQANISNNIFDGLPTTYYYAQWNASDSNTAENPILTVFGANYYLDNDGKVITDLSQYESYFKQVKDKGTALTEAPELAAGEAYGIYSIRYELDGGELENPISAYCRTDGVVQLPLPAKKNYIFLGWFTKNQVEYTELNEALDKSLVLYAKWEPVIGDYYNIKYELDGGAVEGEKVYFSGVGYILPIPTKDNYVFLGWSLEKGSEEYITEILKEQTGDITLYANWEELVYHDVTYDFAGGTAAELYLANGTTTGHISINNYNEKEGTYWGGGYSSYVYITEQKHDPTATFSDRFYIGYDENTGFYTVLSIITSGSSSWAKGAEYVITISSSHSNFRTLSAQLSGVQVGDVVIFDKDIKGITAKNPATAKFYRTVPSESKVSVTICQNDEIIVPTRLGFTFEGWFDAEGKKYEKITDFVADTEVVAKWSELNPVTDIKVENIPTEMITDETCQIKASVIPADAHFTQVIYSTSDKDIISVTENGLLTAVNAGSAIITIRDYVGKIVKTYEIIVHPVASIEVDVASPTYDGVLKIGEEVQLIAQSYGKDLKDVIHTFVSTNENVATVNSDGLVTAVGNGEATIKITDNTGSNYELAVVILVKEQKNEDKVDEVLNLLIDGNFGLVHYGNVSLYDDGAEKYYRATYGSVNHYLFDKFSVDETYYATSDANPNNHKDRRPTDQIEFVTVHDTATLTGTVVSIASGMSSGETSIHYTVGNDAIYGVVREKHIAYHAGDGTSTAFRWIDTGVKGTAGVKPTITVADGKFVVNGTKTAIASPSSKLTELGPVWKVGDNGNYFIGNTWLQSGYGVAASFGGNNNSIGIEMCVNLSGDVYDTWQRTARLVTDILLRNKLDTTRVYQHNTFMGKNCPQCILAGDYWEVFMEMVELNYAIHSQYEGVEISMVSHNPDIIDNTGRVIAAPQTSTPVSYTITVKIGDVSKSVTLHSVVAGTTSWEEWEGVYASSKIWNNGKYYK